VVCQLRTDGTYTVIDVTNPARSVSSGDVDRFFEPFWRRSPSRTDQSHLGLGLPLSRRLAEAMGGRLTAELHGDGLLQVRLELPSAPAARDAQLAAQSTNSEIDRELSLSTGGGTGGSKSAATQARPPDDPIDQPDAHDEHTGAPEHRKTSRDSGVAV